MPELEGSGKKEHVSGFSTDPNTLIGYLRQREILCGSMQSVSDILSALSTGN